MRSASFFMLAFADDFVIFYDDRADHWVWMCFSPCLLRKFNGEVRCRVMVYFDDSRSISEREAT